MTYQEWRNRTVGVLEDVLLQRAFELLQEWKSISIDDLEKIIDQKSGIDADIDLPGDTLNFINWGI